MPLYVSLAPDNKYDPVFERQLAHGVTIALRPLSLPHDWPYIAKWLHRAFGRFSPAAYLPDKHLRETFSIMLQCDFAQPFVGLINDQPVFLVEICDGDKQCDDWEPGAHTFEPGDHAMRLLLSHTVMHWSKYALFSCLDYFFSHPQVKRIVWQLHEKDKYYISLAKQSGVIHSTTPGIQVYLYLRENYPHFLTTYHRHMQKLS